MTGSTYTRIYTVVRRIPRGKVASYGDVARQAGFPGHARQVGYAMHALRPETAVPWHRVVNARGEISRRSRGAGEIEQRVLLDREGVRFGPRGRVAPRHFVWRPTTSTDR